MHRTEQWKELSVPVHTWFQGANSWPKLWCCGVSPGHMRTFLLVLLLMVSSTVDCSSASVDIVLWITSPDFVYVEISKNESGGVCSTGTASTSWLSVVWQVTTVSSCSWSCSDMRTQPVMVNKTPFVRLVIYSSYYHIALGRGANICYWAIGRVWAGSYWWDHKQQMGVCWKSKSYSHLRMWPYLCLRKAVVDWSCRS